MSSTKMRPLVPVPKRASGFSIDSLIGKDTDRDSRRSSSSDESDQPDEPGVRMDSPQHVHRLMGFGSRLPPLHPALPSHVQQLLLSDPSSAGSRINAELLAMRSQAMAFGAQQLNTFPGLGVTAAGHGLGINPHAIQALHQGSQAFHPGLLAAGAARDPMSIYPWMVTRQNPGLMGLSYGPPEGGFFFHPYRKPKRIRTAFSPAQLLKLEQAFEKNHYVVGQERKDLASKLNLTETQVKVWFQNRRTKHKRVKSDDEDGENENISVEEDDEEDVTSEMNKYHAREHAHQEAMYSQGISRDSHVTLNTNSN